MAELYIYFHFIFICIIYLFFGETQHYSLEDGCRDCCSLKYSNIKKHERVANIKILRIKYYYFVAADVVVVLLRLRTIITGRRDVTQCYTLMM